MSGFEPIIQIDKPSRKRKRLKRHDGESEPEFAARRTRDREDHYAGFDEQHIPDSALALAIAEATGSALRSRGALLLKHQDFPPQENEQDGIGDQTLYHHDVDDHDWDGDHGELANTVWVDYQYVNI